jgi:hypothetical protein
MLHRNINLGVAFRHERCAHCGGAKCTAPAQAAGINGAKV